MDAISYSYADKQAKRIKKFNENPDSTSGIVTVPKTIASGETITIPAGRVAILPNVVVDGTLNIDGEVFIPSGSTFGDLDAQIALKADTSYVNAQIALKADTSYVNAQIALKADTSYVNAQLGLKQNVLVANDAGVKTALNASGTAPIYANRAVANLNGIGTVSIRSSGNISSITDIGTGDLRANFIVAMPSANYCANLTIGHGNDNFSSGYGSQVGLYENISIRFSIFITATGAPIDAPVINLSISK